MSISRKSYEASSRKIAHSENLLTPVISALSKEVLNEMKYRIAQNFGGVVTASKLAEKTLAVDKTGLLFIS